MDENNLLHRIANLKTESLAWTIGFCLVLSCFIVMVLVFCYWFKKSTKTIDKLVNKVDEKEKENC